MKITHIIMNLDAGGAQTFLASLAIEQSKLGHNVSIIVIDQLVNSGFQKVLVNSLTDHGVTLHLLNRRPGRNKTILSTIRGITQTLSAVEPDIINSYISTSHLITNLVLRVAKLKKLKKRHIITVQNAPENWNMVTLKLNAHTPSIYCSQAALEINPKRNCISVAIPNAIPFPIVDNSAKEILAPFYTDKERKFVLCVGRLSRQKNYGLVCKIAEHFEDKNVDFVICGLKQETAEQDLENFKKFSNIHYIGVKSREEVYSLMGNCDCFLNSSLFEGLPLTVLEAFFTGIPCVLSEIPPHIEIGTNIPHCYMASLESEKPFIKGIETALGQFESKEDILNLRMPFLEKYAISNTAKDYDKFYTQILNGI
jgi:glycosyltransferase involved in cell wall biosynthesis